MAEICNFVKNVLQISYLQKNGGVIFYYGFKAWLLLHFVFMYRGYCIKLLMVHEFCISYKINVIDHRCIP
jgi:hypothetical protein